MLKYIHQHENWTKFTWNDAIVNMTLGEARLLQGMVFGHMHSLGFSSKEEKNLNVLTLDVMKSSEIEGEMLDHEYYAERK